MKTNIESIQEVLDYIELHLEENLSLDVISNKVNYSKYHLSRMFVSFVGFTLHTYIQRRRLSEAARLLVYTDTSILDISLYAGYETQRSFSTGFKALYKCSPQAYRKKGLFYPLQSSINKIKNGQIKGDQLMDIRIEAGHKITLVGYQKSTKHGFMAIGKCWHALHAHKQMIQHRTDMNFLIGLNDYSQWDNFDEKQPAFDYFAAAEVKYVERIPKGMQVKELEATKYIVFSYRANSKDSLQPIADYIYKEWFPQSSCELDEHARYDFAKYGEQVDNDGKSLIEYWVPILSS